MWYRLNVAVFAWYFRRAFGFRIEGQEDEPRPPFIIVANHASAVDPPLVTRAVRARIAFAAKVELAHHPLVKLWLRSVGGFFVRRGQGGRQAIRAGLEVLRRGRALGTDPVGKGSMPAWVCPGQAGAAYGPFKIGVPVLPI